MIRRWKGRCAYRGRSRANGKRSFTLFYGPARRRPAPETLIPRCAARDISFSAVFSNWTSFRTHGWLFGTHTRDNFPVPINPLPLAPAIFSNYDQKQSLRNGSYHKYHYADIDPVIPLHNLLLRRILPSFLRHFNSGKFLIRMWSALANQRGAIFRDATSKRRKCLPKWKQGPKRCGSK